MDSEHEERIARMQLKTLPAEAVTSAAIASKFRLAHPGVFESELDALQGAIKAGVEAREQLAQALAAGQGLTRPIALVDKRAHAQRDALDALMRAMHKEGVLLPTVGFPDETR